MKLVIVESPTKSKTIQEYLGKGYEVVASCGHVRDLATCGENGFGVDVKNEFKPTYKISKDKTGVINNIKDKARKADEVILATDPDREGEAIAWHLAKILNLDLKKNKRLEFHEITHESIKAAIENPRIIDMNLVSSQETRRILDRIIGFSLSKIINRKIHSKGAGRVQSAVLKLIVDLDNEIKSFVSEEYYNIQTSILLGRNEQNLTYIGYKKKKEEIKTKDAAEKIINHIPANLKVSSINVIKKSLASKLPFSTSTMQQEGFNKLKYKTSKTQAIAQELFYGVDIGGQRVGLVTYIRTDSTRMSPSFVEKARAYITEKYGAEYLGSLKQGKKGAKVQDAHECIRPTSLERTPESIKKYLRPEQYCVYKMIYERTLMSLMKDKIVETTNVVFDGNEEYFTTEFNKTLFPGYEIVNNSDRDEKPIPDVIQIGKEFKVTKKEAEQKFTQGPSPFNDGKLVKTMEEVGIGRPSTYVSTIQTLKKHKYINYDDKGYIIPTEQGILTSNVLNKYFTDIVDTKYTADMENDLDDIQDGSSNRLNMLTNFYQNFMAEVGDAYIKMYPEKDRPVGRVCPKCGAELVYKQGDFGEFIGCSNYPKCDYREGKKSVETGEKCPKCGSPLIERSDEFGNKYYACSSYPKCKYIIPKPFDPLTDTYVKKCPNCDGYLIKKKGKYGVFLGCTNYPTCNHMEKIKKHKK